MFYRLIYVIIFATVAAAMLPRLSAVEHERLSGIAKTRGVEYRKKIEVLALEIATGKVSFQFPLGDVEDELIARSAGVRAVDPYLGLWLDGQFANFIWNLSKSDEQKKAWAKSDPIYDGMLLDASSSEAFAFYGLSADRRMNWPTLAYPPLVDPVTYLGDGPRHDNTFIAILEALAFQSYEGTAAAELEQPAFNHSRAAWMRLISVYLINYSGTSDDPWRAIATEVLYRRIMGPETSSILRAVWVETYAAIVPDETTGAPVAEKFLESGNPCEVIAGARAAYVLVRRFGSEELRVRLRNETSEALVHARTKPIEECLETLVGAIDDIGRWRSKGISSPEYLIFREQDSGETHSP